MILYIIHINHSPKNSSRLEISMIGFGFFENNAETAFETFAIQIESDLGKSVSQSE